MRIAVCIKQVPRLDQVRFSRSNRVVRKDVDCLLNPADLPALGCALALREEVGGEVVAVTLGPLQARVVLEEAVQRGADRALHVTDKRFAGSDTLATARALARALEREHVDLVVFGRSTLDGATGQLGPQVAELAGLPQVTGVVELSVKDSTVHAVREVERGEEKWEARLPVVVVVARGPNPPEPDPDRDASERIDAVNAEALGGRPIEYGTRGSPTFVRAIVPRDIERQRERLEDLEKGVDRLRELLRRALHQDAPRPSAGQRRTKAIWVVAERHDDQLHPVSLEGLTCAHSVAGKLDAEVIAVLLCADPGDWPEQLGAHGADRVLVVADPGLEEYGTEPFTAALCAAITEYEPLAVIGGWTSQGRDFLPRAAARLGLGLTGDFVSLEVQEADPPRLLWVKPAWAGTVHAPIMARTPPSMGTLRPGAVGVPKPQDDRSDVPVDVYEPGLEPPGQDANRPACTGRRTIFDRIPLVDSAPAIFLAGEDLDEETVAAVAEAAAALGAGLGGTAGACARGHLAPQLEVSVLRRSIAPALCVAFGVQDAQALDPVRGATTIVTVHHDPDASVHERADLALLADPADVAARLGNV